MERRRIAGAIHCEVDSIVFIERISCAKMTRLDSRLVCYSKRFVPNKVMIL